MKTPDPLFDAVESFFIDYLKLLRGSSPKTLVSYRDSLRLLFDYVSRVRKTSIERLRLTDFDADLIAAFLQHLERDRHNRVSTRNCWLAALHSFFPCPAAASRACWTLGPHPRLAVQAPSSRAASIP